MNILLGLLYIRSLVAIISSSPQRTAIAEKNALLNSSAFDANNSPFTCRSGIRIDYMSYSSFEEPLSICFSLCCSVSPTKIGVLQEH